MSERMKEVKDFDFLRMTAEWVCERYGRGSTAMDFDDLKRDRELAKGYLNSLKEVLGYFDRRGSLNGLDGLDSLKELLEDCENVDDNHLSEILERVSEVFDSPEIKHLADAVLDD